LLRPCRLRPIAYLVGWVNRHPGALAVAAIVTMLSATAALAAVPDANGFIHSCYKTNGGALRIIDPETTKSCDDGESLLGWRQVDAPPPVTILWANILNKFGTPELIYGKGVVNVAPDGKGQVRVTFNRDVRHCSHQATSWLHIDEGASATWTDAPIMAVERGINTNSIPAEAVRVHAYTGSTGQLDSTGNYDFSLTVFC
jgi:hypothetical protein